MLYDNYKYLSTLYSPYVCLNYIFNIISYTCIYFTGFAFMTIVVLTCSGVVLTCSEVILFHAIISSKHMLTYTDICTQMPIMTKVAIHNHQTDTSCLICFAVIEMLFLMTNVPIMAKCHSLTPTLC